MNGDISKGAAIGTTSTAAALVILAQPVLAKYGYQMTSEQVGAAVALIAALGHGPLASLLSALISKVQGSPTPTPPTP